MSLNKIATRYAKSLLDLASEQSKVDRVLQDVKTFQEAVKQRDLALLLKSPIIKSDKKLTILNEIFGKHFDELSMSFFNIITRKKREAALPAIADSFVQQYQAMNKITKVTITTAGNLNDDDLANIKAKLDASSVTQDTVEIDTIVNPDLIGGFILQIGDKLYDASVAYKLEQLKKQFSGDAITTI